MVEQQVKERPKEVEELKEKERPEEVEVDGLSKKRLGQQEMCELSVLEEVIERQEEVKR